MYGTVLTGEWQDLMKKNNVLIWSSTLMVSSLILDQVGYAQKDIFFIGFSLQGILLLIVKKRKLVKSFDLTPYFCWDWYCSHDTKWEGGILKKNQTLEDNFHIKALKYLFFVSN